MEIDLTGGRWAIDVPIRATRLESTVATGTAPLIIASTTLVTNLNAQYLDGLLKTAFALASHVHAAGDVTSGVFDPARIPVITSAVQIISTGGIADLDAGQQTDVVKGCVVTTTDGQRWTYTGSGSKTSEASYIPLADITPAWTVVAGKPALVVELGDLTKGTNQLLLVNGSGDLAFAACTADAQTFLAATDFAAMAALLPISGGGGLDTLTSAASVDLDFDGATSAKLSIAHNVTFTTSNKAADTRKKLTILGHASNSYTLMYPGGWKNAGGTALPSSIPASAVYVFNLECFGTAETDVVVEWVNGAGVAVSLTPAPAQECPKAGSAGFNLGSNVVGGPNLGWLTVSLSASAGTFVCGNGNGLISETLDPDSGRHTAKQFLTTRDNVASHLTGATWYPPTSSGIPQVGAGSITLTISDVINSPFWNISVTSYGADEVQQLDWMNTGSPYTPAAGTFTLTTVGGTTGTIAASGGASAMQSALTTLLGGNAPTVTGGGSTYSFTWSNGIYAHTDVTEIAVNEVTTIHDGSNMSWSAPMRQTTGDGVSIADSFTGSWDMGVGTIDWGSGPITKGSGSFSIGGVTYNVVDSGFSYTVTCTDFDPHSDISATPNYGLPLTPTMSTPTPGNS